MIYITLYLQWGKGSKKDDMSRLSYSHMYSYRLWSLSLIPWLSEDIEKQFNFILLPVILYIELYCVISIKTIKGARKKLLWLLRRNKLKSEKLGMKKGLPSLYWTYRNKKDYKEYYEQLYVNKSDKSENRKILRMI